MKWEGFEDRDGTWEPLERLYEDVPTLVNRYVASVTNVTVRSRMEKVIRGLKQSE